MNGSSAPAKRRAGCLGCFGQVVLILFVGLLVSYLLMAAFSPWGFYLGGHFHPIPMWQGWGKIHTPNGGDYVLYVSVWPATRGRSHFGFASLTGTGYVCTPRHERIFLSVGGDILEKHLGRDSLGKPVHIYMYHRSAWSSFSGDNRPSFSWYGNWGDDQLTLDDHNSMSWAFTPDGHVYRSGSSNHTAAFGPLQVTLRAGSLHDFDSACSALP